MDLGPILKHKFNPVEPELSTMNHGQPAAGLRVSKQWRSVFRRKYLDTIAVDTLYKRARAITVSRTARKKLSMMTSRTNKKHSTKWQPCAAMYTVVCSLGLSSASVSLRTNIFGGRLGQEASIDSRYIRQ